MIASLFLLLFTNNLILINILLFAFGFFASTFITLFTLYIEIVQNNPKKIAIYNACMAAGWFLGVQTGGILIDIYGIRHIFVFSLVPFVLSIFPVIFIKEDRKLILEQTKKLSESNQSFEILNKFEDERASFRTILSSLFFRSFGLRPLLGSIIIIMGFHLTSDIEKGFLIGINPLFQFFLMLLIGKIISKKNLKIIVLLGYILSIFVILGYIYSIDFWGFLIFQLLMSLSYSLLWMGSITYIAQNSTHKNKGRYIGHANTSAFAGDSLGGLFYSLMLLVFLNDYYISMYFMIIFPVISLIIISLRFKPYKKTIQGSRKSLNS
jgi:MFS family permease